MDLAAFIERWLDNSSGAERANRDALLDAAQCDWSGVEPTIFGTLLERALSKEERHKLGAHFTPRAYIERLVRPTVEEPLRAEWENAQVAAHKLRAAGKREAAKEVVHVYHQKLCQTRVLDPACGSGNFLYVTLDIFKQIESEVLALLGDLGEKQEQLLRVTPRQFLGIEKQPRAKEIAELVLWIRYSQWHHRTHGKRCPPPEPALQDLQNIECRDAVLAWDRIELVKDGKGEPVERYVGPRMAQWPEADYIVGNPPFVGNKRMRTVLGDGYVAALREAHQDVPDTADYVMYWWNHAAGTVRLGKARRFGLITTNSITQKLSRRVVEAHLSTAKKLSFSFAIPDHPWVDASTGADVRVAMTVGVAGDHQGTLHTVVDESGGSDGVAEVTLIAAIGIIHPDLSIGANVTGVVSLRANQGMCFQGVILVGEGFRMYAPQVIALGYDVKALPPVIRPTASGKDVVQRAREWYVIDLYGLSEDEARGSYPTLYQHLYETVRPHRLQNRDNQRRVRWWLFGRSNEAMRGALQGLPRYVATVETSKFKVFVFLDGTVCPDHKLYAVASDDAYILGALSSRVHVAWALSAGGRLGVGNDPTWTSTTCFLPFPFPACSAAQQKRIRALGERLDAHRKARQAAHPDLTITGTYNVLEKLRAGAELTDKERDVHERGLVSILKKIHDDLDAAVEGAYGWSPDLTDEQILEKLVALNAERAAEEKKGLVRWLRPDFQNPSGKRAATQEALLPLEEAEETAPPSEIKPWPKKIVEQIAAVRDRVAAPGKVFSVESVAAAFKGAKKKDVEGYLDGFAALGVLTVFETPRGKRWRAAGKGT